MVAKARDACQKRLVFVVNPDMTGGVFVARRGFANNRVGHKRSADETAEAHGRPRNLAGRASHSRKSAFIKSTFCLNEGRQRKNFRLRLLQVRTKSNVVGPPIR